MCSDITGKEYCMRAHPVRLTGSRESACQAARLAWQKQSKRIKGCARSFSFGMRDALPSQSAGSTPRRHAVPLCRLFSANLRFSRKSAWSSLLLLQMDCARSFILPNQKTEKAQEGCHQKQTTVPPPPRVGTWEDGRREGKGPPSN